MRNNARGKGCKREPSEHLQPQLSHLGMSRLVTQCLRFKRSARVCHTSMSHSVELHSCAALKEYCESKSQADLTSQRVRIYRQLATSCCLHESENNFPVDVGNREEALTDDLSRPHHGNVESPSPQ